MNDRAMITEQVQRMRHACVEPEVITVSYEVYKALGKPRALKGVPIDCDDRLTSGFEVR